MRKTFRSLVPMGVALLLLWGLVRAATNRFEERREAIHNACRAERSRLGLTDEQIRAKYPTPQVTLCRIVRVLPGGAGEVVTRGNFLAGTKFLFDNDNIEVLKEALTPGAGQRESEYRATIRVGPSAGPDSANLYSFQPVTCRNTYCQAVYIGGKYEWDFTADNGWRIRLTPVREPASGDDQVVVVYRAEFYRGGENRPFEVWQVAVGGNPSGYSGQIEAESAGPEAELGNLSMKMMDPKLSEREREQLIKRQSELVAKMQAQIEKMGDPKFMEEMEKKKQEFGCHVMNFSLTQSGVEGNMLRGEKVGKPDNPGRLELKGTVKYLGP